MKELCKRVFYFYIDGFKNMKVGKRLWLIIGIKLFVFFVVLKIFFFPDILQTRFTNDRARADFVLENITR